MTLLSALAHVTGAQLPPFLPPTSVVALHIVYIVDVDIVPANQSNMEVPFGQAKGGWSLIHLCQLTRHSLSPPPLNITSFLYHV